MFVMSLTHAELLADLFELRITHLEDRPDAKPAVRSLSSSDAT